MEKKEVIYLINHNKYLTEALIKILNNLRFEVVVFSDLKEMVNILKENVNAPSVVIANFESRHDFLDEVKFKWPETKIIFTVNLVENAAQCRIENSRYLEVPLADREITKKLNQILLN